MSLKRFSSYVYPCSVVLIRGPPIRVSSDSFDKFKIT